VDLNDFTENNVCISGVNGDFGPLASYTRPFGPRAYNSTAGQNRLLHALNTGCFLLEYENEFLAETVRSRLQTHSDAPTKQQSSFARNTNTIFSTIAF
jgi:hypothetical protein